MQRAIWKGDIEIGLLNIPIQIHSITSDREYSFSLLCPNCKKQITYKKICPACNQEWKDSELLRGIKIISDEFIIFTKEELDNCIKKVNDHKIKIFKVFKLEDIDPIYIKKNYALLPQIVRKGRNKFYANLKAFKLLMEILSLYNLALLGKYINRDKEYKVIIRPYQNYLLMSVIYYTEQVKELELDYLDELKGINISDKEKELFSELLKRMKSDLDETDFENEDKTLDKLIEAKMGGKEIVAEIKIEQKKEDNLEDLLKKSLEVKV